MLASCSPQKLEFEKSSGKANTIKAGKSFKVTLTENHMQDYYWSFKGSSNPVVVSYYGSAFHGDKSGEVDFNFEAVKADTATLVFTLQHFRDSVETRQFRIKAE